MLHILVGFKTYQVLKTNMTWGHKDKCLNLHRTRPTNPS
jgi:hypothetical protein